LIHKKQRDVKRSTWNINKMKMETKVKKVKTLQDKENEARAYIMNNVYGNENLIFEFEKNMKEGLEYIEMKIKNKTGFLYNAITEDITKFCDRKEYNYLYIAKDNEVIMIIIIN